MYAIIDRLVQQRRLRIFWKELDVGDSLAFVVMCVAQFFAQNARATPRALRETVTIHQNRTPYEQRRFYEEASYYGRIQNRRCFMLSLHLAGWCWCLCGQDVDGRRHLGLANEGKI